MLFLFTAMPNKTLHIISFDNPYPADYGGVIDVFYKIKSLHALGYSIYLHCFYEHRAVVAPELKAITKEVYLYKKNRNPWFLFSAIPFGVKSRFHKDLLKNSNAIKAPIWFEGLQSTRLAHQMESEVPLFLRLHNIESKFYAGMWKSETQFLKKALYFFEKRKYATYERQLQHFKQVFTLSVHENELVKSWHKAVSYLPVFHGNVVGEPLSEKGNYALYHGDLRLPDNKKAAQFLIEVFKEIPTFKLIIASSNGKEMVLPLIQNQPNIVFEELTSEAQLDNLLQEAHINVLLSFQKSGTKLKLINALFKSRFCLINENMVDDENILQLCELATKEADFVAKVNQLIDRPFQDHDRRAKVLNEVLNDAKNAQKLVEILEG